jgi:putative chitinase
MITVAQLQMIMPRAGQRADAFASHLDKAMSEFSINTPIRQAAFLAQAAHESNQLASLTENLNYSAPRLRQVWPTRFPSDEVAAAYANNPQKLASKVYADRMGNGSEASGDGWNYRGRGIFQLTGKDNYARCGAKLGIDLIEHPDLVAGPEIAARSAAWFWDRNGLNSFADTGDIVGMTKKINGGTLGLQERIALFGIAKQVLA